MTFENLFDHINLLDICVPSNISTSKHSSYLVPYDQPEVLPVDGELDAEGDGGVDSVEDDGAGDLGEDVDYGLPDVPGGGEQGGVGDGEAEGEGGVAPHPAPHTVQGRHVRPVPRLRVQTHDAGHVRTEGQSN